MDAKRALVSVVIPSYNHAAFVGEAVRSVAQQEGIDLEIVVVDDGSTDGSPAIVERALEGCSCRCELVVQANRGAHAAINRGLSLARGTHLHILNSDDRFGVRRLARMLGVIGSAREALAFSDVCVIGADGRPLPRFHPRATWCRRARRILLSEPTIGYGLLRINAAITTSNFLFTRELLGRAGEFTPEKLCHDWTFLLHVLPWAEPIHVPEPLLDYRIHGNNTVDRVMALRRQEGEPALRQYFRYVSECVPENMLAPCDVWWPGFFPVFIATRRPWFADEPMERFLPTATHAGRMAGSVEATGGNVDSGIGDDGPESVRTPIDPQALLSARTRDMGALQREVQVRDRLLADYRRVASGVGEPTREACSASWREALLRISMLAAPFSGSRPTAVIFGASKGGERALAFLRSCWQVAAFVDNDASKQGREFCGLPVMPPSALNATDGPVVFVASAYRDAIHSQLCAAGIARHRVHHVDAGVVAEMMLSEHAQPRVVLFGCESGAREVVRHLAGSCLLFAHDDEPVRAGTVLTEMLDLPLPEGVDSEFDYVVVASPRASEIVERLDELGCPLEKIVVAHPDFLKSARDRDVPEARIQGHVPLHSQPEPPS